MKKKIEIRDMEHFLCQCYSTDHSFTYHYNEEDNEIYVHVHLSNYRNIFKRIWVAIKYIFGYKSRYGDFEEFILNPDDRDRLIGVIKQLKDPEEHNKTCCGNSKENCKCNN